MHPRRRDAATAAVAALVAFLPFLRGTLGGACLYFRDLSRQFFPLRHLALEGLARGEVRFWNPYVHEGIPLSLPALGYPPDLLQLLRPGEPGLSLVLALHVPLAALAFFALCRGLRLPATAAAGGAVVYALGGFVLSAVNLYVYVQAAAWAPLLVLALVRLLASGRRLCVAAAAAALAISLSTTGAEVVAQALVVALVLGWPGEQRLRRAASTAAALGLGLSIAAPVVVLVGAQVEGSARSQGFPTDVVLAHSIHPMTLVQTLVAGLYGNTFNLVNEWWGQNFFPRGFPYVLSLYLGAAALCLAIVGMRQPHPLRARLAWLAAAATVVGLGRWAGLAPVVDALGPLRAFRFPVKAFFTVHFALALLAALGLAALLEGGRSAWRRLATSAAVLGGGLVGLLALPLLAPASLTAFARGFFPPGYSDALRGVLLGRVLGDAAAGGGIALGVAAVSLLVLGGRLPAPRAAALVLALVACDLLRAGAGLNPMVERSFFEPSPELAALLPTLRQGRVFTCEVQETEAYALARAARGGDHELWSFAVVAETLTPQFNVREAVAAALSPDMTMLVPVERTLSPEEASCRDLDAILPRLRRAGVSRLLSVAPLRHPELAPEALLQPPRIAPLGVFVYRVVGAGALARVDEPGDAGAGVNVTGDGTGARVQLAAGTPGRIRALVDAPRPGTLVLVEGWSPGWQAELDGRRVEVRRTDDSHCAIAVPAGRSRVVMSYRPPRLELALVLAAAGLVAAVGIGWPRRQRAP